MSSEASPAVAVKPGDIRFAAMNLLSRREHAQRELSQKLAKRFPDSAEVIQSELDKLKQEGLQSDARLAEVFVRSRTNRGQGPLKIQMELRGKGIDEDTFRRAVSANEIDWFGLVRQVATKKFGESPPTDAREKAKRSRFLQQRGFNFDHIRTLF